MATQPESPEYEQVARLAYDLWEGEGRPQGRHLDHWERAERLFREAGGSVSSDTREPAPAQDGDTTGSEGDPEKDHTYVRPAGRKEMDLPPSKWSEIDETIDESFPASDPPGNY